MSTIDNRAIVRRFIEEVLVGGDFAALAELTAVTCVDHAASAGQLAGLAGIVPLMTAWRAAFPDLAIAIEELVAEGERVTVRSTVCGTHRGTFLGVPPTGRRVAVTAMAIYRLAGGRIVERWAVVDTLEVLRQLGAAPPLPAGSQGARRAPVPA